MSKCRVFQETISKKPIEYSLGPKCFNFKYFSQLDFGQDFSTGSSVPVEMGNSPIGGDDKFKYEFAIREQDGDNSLFYRVVEFCKVCAHKKFHYKLALVNVNGENCFCKENFFSQKWEKLVDVSVLKDPANGLLHENNKLIFYFKSLSCYFQNDCADHNYHSLVKNKFGSFVSNNSFSSNMATLLESQLYSDFVFVVDGVEFKVHKFIITARAPSLAAIIAEGDTYESQQGSCILNGVTADAFGNLLKFVYSATLPQPSELDLDLLVAANEYQIVQLKSACETQLGTTLSAESVLKVLSVAHTCKATDLKNVCIKFICKYANDIRNLKDLQHSQPILASELNSAMDVTKNEVQIDDAELDAELSFDKKWNNSEVWKILNVSNYLLNQIDITIEMFTRMQKFRQVEFKVQQQLDSSLSWLYVRLCYTFKCPCEKVATFQIGLLNAKNKKCFVKELKLDVWEKFVDIASLFDSTNGLLQYDQLTVYLKVSPQNETKKPIFDLIKLNRKAKKQLCSDMTQLWKDKQNCDFLYQVKSEHLIKEFNVHKAIISAQAPMLAALFSHNNTKESLENRSIITDLTETAFYHLLKFLYTGTLPEKLDLNLLIAANKYGIFQLKFACEAELGTTITIESVSKMLVLADMYSAAELKDICIKFVCKHDSDVIKCENWEKLVCHRSDLLTEVLHHIVGCPKRKHVSEESSEHELPSKIIHLD